MMRESRKEAFYSDLVTLILVVLVVGVLVLLLSFSLPGDRVTTGIWLTGSISSIVFFYLRGRFSFWATLAQILAVGGLTASQVWVVGLMLSELPIIKGTITRAYSGKSPLPSAFALLAHIRIEKV